MTGDDGWWNTPLTKGIASLALALAITFLPIAIDGVRARRQAAPVEIVASPGVVVDSLGEKPCTPDAGDTSRVCPPTDGPPTDGRK